MNNKLSCKEARILMMGLIDNELSNDNKLVVMEHINSCSACQTQFDSFNKLKEEEIIMNDLPLSEEIFDEYWTHVYNRIERATGWVILSIGTIITLTYAAYMMLKTFFYDESEPMVLKFGVAFLAIGLIIVFVSVLREKLRIRKSDKYRRILR